MNEEPARDPRLTTATAISVARSLTTCVSRNDALTTEVFQALGRERAGWQVCGERYLRAVSDVARVLPGIRPQERQILGRSADVGSATRHGKASAGLLLREGATGHGARAVSVACGAFHRRPGVHFHGPLHAREDGRAPIRPRNRRNPATGVCQVPGQTTGGRRQALPRRRHVSRLVMPPLCEGG
jgi:hypothetical protein